MSAPNPKADFERYLESADAQEAEAWQLRTLSVLRNCIGEPLTNERYASLRAELVSKFGNASAEARS